MLPLVVLVPVIGGIAAFLVGSIVGLAYGVIEAMLFRASTLLLRCAGVTGSSRVTSAAAAVKTGQPA